MGKSPSYSPSFLSEEADAACRAAMRHVSRMEQMIYALRLDQDRGDEFQGRIRDCIVAIVVEVETFTFSRILNRLDVAVSKTRSRLTEALYKKERPMVDKSWDNVCRAALDYLSVNVRSIESFRKVMGYVDIRNSTVHGNGKLTPKQVSNNEVLSRLRLIKVDIANGQVVLNKGHARDAANSVRSFVTTLDSITWDPPSFP